MTSDFVQQSYSVILSAYVPDGTTAVSQTHHHHHQVVARSTGARV